MVDFFEINEKSNSVKILNLDDFSLEDLNKYIAELKEEIVRVETELLKKEKIQKEANKLFK